MIPPRIPPLFLIVASMIVALALSLFGGRGTAASASSDAITPIREMRAMYDAQVELGERLFRDVRLSKNNSHSCNTCHDLQMNGASRAVKDKALDGSLLTFNTSTVFNAALSFRLGWQGEFRTLQDHAAASLRNPMIMGGDTDDVLAKLRRDPEMSRQFRTAYGREPDARALFDAIAAFERSLVTPNSRFDRYLAGDSYALSPRELSGYQQFKSLGCISCHQGVNVGGNLFQRPGIFRPLLRTTGPATVRVPSLRNIAATAPYFHDGSAATLEEAVRRMASAQLNSTLTPEQVADLVAYLHTLTGDYRGRNVGAFQ